ncbi:putative fungal lipase-like domain, alpha/Beta hydrolase [Septoria linicola]|nr:putative fungal lipase-like domain, alpha/Beta hydrolase [Septoria linicola]
MNHSSFQQPPRTTQSWQFPHHQQQQHVYGDAAYTYSHVRPHGQYIDDMSTPMSPPPQYDPYRNDYDYGQQPSRAFYLQPVQSQQQLYVPAETIARPDGRLRRKASAWASTLDLSQAPARPPQWQQQQRKAWQSSADLSAPPLPTRPAARRSECPLVQAMNQGSALCDRVASVAARVNEVFSRIDEQDHDHDEELAETTRGLMTIKETEDGGTGKYTSMVDFRKTWLYANSRLPPFMLPMKIYIPTWQIICMAAQASSDVYRRPQRDEREDFVEADWQRGTKAMVIKTRPVDDKNIIVLAIRGSKTWNPVDWAINFRTLPTEPLGFLDDAGNAVHAGFLQIARAMVAPVAARLRSMLEQSYSRGPPTLILTGHSAGGAVASLLFMHMMATTLSSELNDLTGFFKRIHCITFGTPPVSFLPLQKPSGKQYERNVFLHFANEGDVVVRADRSYMSTIVRIVAAPSPMSTPNTTNMLRKHMSRQTLKGGYQAGNKYQPPRWEVPPATLSNAGRMVLLREKPGSSRRRAIEAVQVTDEELRDVIFGDPEMHRMELYKRRIDELAIAAVTGRGVG